MRVLASGSHGFIGTALADQLVAAGHTVVRLVRTASPERPPAAAAAADTVAWDPTSGRLDTDGLVGQGPFDAVVHLAGAGIGDRRWSERRKREIFNSRTAATSLLARTVAGLDPRPGVLVSASAVGWYGDRGSEELTEDSAAGSGFLAEVCRAWEQATEPAARAGVRVVTLRSGIVLSPAGGALGRLLPMFRLGLGARLGTGHQYVSWISQRDELAVIERALTDPALEGPVNAVAPRPVTNADFTRAVARAVHRPAFLSVPPTALRAALGSEMADELLLGGQRALPARLTAVGHRFTDADLPDALAVMLAATS